MGIGGDFVSVEIFLLLVVFPCMCDLFCNDNMHVFATRVHTVCVCTYQQLCAMLPT